MRTRINYALTNAAVSVQIKKVTIHAHVNKLKGYLVEIVEAEEDQS